MKKTVMLPRVRLLHVTYIDDLIKNYKSKASYPLISCVSLVSRIAKGTYIMTYDFLVYIQ